MNDDKELTCIPVEEAIARGLTPDPALAGQLAETAWWKQVIANTNRMARDEDYRKSIAKDIS